MHTSTTQNLAPPPSTETVLSDVDGQRGQLIVAGDRIEDLAGRTPFEALCARLWSLGDGRARDADETKRALGRARQAAFERLPALRGLQLRDGMAALRATLAQLEDDGDDGEVALTGATAVLAAAWARTRAGETPVEPDPHADHAADYLRMVRGEPAAPAEQAAMDAYFVTVADHGMNASTYAARVVISTRSDRVSAVVAAVGALKGPLHGGAPGPVLAMLDAIGHERAAPAWLAARLAAGERIMGMGHRIYRVRDPRAEVLERVLRDLEDSRAAGAPSRLSLARAVERVAEDLLAARRPGRALRANVEFYTAVLLEALGLDPACFSTTFAAARVAGWLAHVAEQLRTGRLIRPEARYVGRVPSVPGPLS